MDTGDVQEAVYILGDTTRRPPIDFYNVLESTNYRWTINASPDARVLAPRIYINLLQMTGGQLAQFVAQIEQLTSDPYNGLYSLEKIGETLTFPFFSTAHHFNQNEWEELTMENFITKLSPGGMGNAIGKYANQVLGSAQLYRSIKANFSEPAFKTETPRVWDSINLESIVFTFNLFNSNTNQYILNKRMVDYLVHHSLPEKRQQTFATPPALCEYDIPGVRRGLLASFNVDVATKGQCVYDDTMGGKGVNIPDAFEVTITLQDLLMQTKNIHFNRPLGLTEQILGSPGAINVYQYTGSGDVMQQANNRIDTLRNNTTSLRTDAITKLNTIPEG